jgi:(R,R)-butanediol dehydrogenase/meso-butanediol dehydrogenase/diacetyl reductase
VTVRERLIVGSNGYASGPLADKEFGMITSMMVDGVLDPESLITARIDLDEIVEYGFEALLDEENDDIKILVRP